MIVIKNNTLKNIVTLMTGTLGAQVFALAITPVITRLYAPDQYGMMGMFLAIIIVLVPISALTLPAAIVLPKLDEDAKSLAFISIMLSAVFSIFLFIVLLIALNPLVERFNLESIKWLLLLVPVTMFFSTFHQVFEQWMIRNKQFKFISKISIFQSLSLNGSKAVTGLFAPFGSSLIVLTSLGYAIHSVLFFFSGGKTLLRDIVNLKKSNQYYWQLLKRYIDFPVFRAPNVFLNLASQSLPILFLATTFGPTAAGFYTLARTMMNIPATLIGKAVGDVFYPKLSELKINKLPIYSLFAKTTLILAALGIIPYLTVFLFGEFLFGLVFGAKWSAAGVYAGWLSIWIYTIFLSPLCTNILAVINRQGFNLLNTIIKVAVRTLILIGCIYYKISAIESVILFSVASATINIIFILVVLYMVKKHDEH
tara:strand:- start:11871 stop:13142 length:1272 start_codon:yes stop_codon:yes gene_type:complete